MITSGYYSGEVHCGDVPLARKEPRARAQPWRFNVPGILVSAVLVICWELAAASLPKYLFPSLHDLALSLVKLCADPAFYLAVGRTYLRIVVALLLSFGLSVCIGVAAGLKPAFDRGAAPVLALLQGIPGVCWIIFAILWFKNVELRIAFIVIVSTAPNFYYQTRDGVLGISAELREMVLSWRASRRQIITMLVIPALTPVLLTTLLINLGIGTKVGVTAELLAGMSGIGGELRSAQEQFRMDMAFAWTVPLVLFVLGTNWLTQLAQHRLLRWRPKLEHRT